MFSLTFLGTGAAEGFPGVFCACPACERARLAGGRNLKTRSCSLLDDAILIDLSPDIFPQALALGINLSKIKTIVFTHTHADHLNLYALMSRANENASIFPDAARGMGVIDVFGNKAVGGSIERGFLENPGFHRDRINYHAVEAGDCFQAGGLRFHALSANHKKDEDCLIYIVEDGHDSLLYANDTGFLSEESFGFLREYGKRFNVVSLDCARGLLPGDGHMGLAEDLETIKRLRAMGAIDESTTLLLNHFSHMSGITPQEFGERIKDFGLSLAFDGLKVTV
jgi:phosphoribosyl 1,2-cyclic phosphate phosphodiesterase